MRLYCHLIVHISSVTRPIVKRMTEIEKDDHRTTVSSTSIQPSNPPPTKDQQQSITTKKRTAKQSTNQTKISSFFNKK